jgi:soluble lytic murein transglycosylase-like protein
MKRVLPLAWLAGTVALALSQPIQAQQAEKAQQTENAQQADDAQQVERAQKSDRAPQVVSVPAAFEAPPSAKVAHAKLSGHREYDALVATHAKANAVPEALIHRVIVRESRYQPELVGRGGTIGLMQIKLATARSLGYTGDAEGLRDPNTNLTYAVKYLAGAYRAANGDHNRAVAYYASGYYEAAKRQRLERARHPEPVFASAPPKDAAKLGKDPADANAKAEQVPE